MHRVHRFRTSVQVLAVVCAAAAPVYAYRLAETTVVVPPDASAMVRLASDEIARYVYLLTSKLPETAAAASPQKVAIVLRTGGKDRVPQEGPDPNQNYALYAESDRQIVHGAGDAATLWAAYHLIESWGAGFYLGGDALPPADPEKEVTLVEEKCVPALKIRGNLPWFNFLNSPTTWNPQDYKSFLSQMAKQRANFIGFHVYDHEPFCGYDLSTLRTSGSQPWPHPAASGGPLMTTTSPHRWWSPPAMPTSDFLFGTDQFFDRGEWGCEVGIDEAWSYNPARATGLQQEMMADALRYARRIGLRTCLGFEVHDNPLDDRVSKEFRRKLEFTVRTYPLDYVWIWQSEGRGTAGTAGNWVAGAPNDASIKLDEQIGSAFQYLGPQHDLREAARITRYVLLAHGALRELAPSTRLIVSGWGGDAHMHFSTLYEGLDKVVPDDVIFASLDNIDPRLEDHVSQTYGKLKPSRERWPIPWFESDGGHSRIDQTGPQTNVTAFEPLLKDMVKKGCQGALGIHWRTRNVEDVAGYLYRFGWNPQLTAAEFFKQYARDQYGPDQADHMAGVHLRLEEFGPQYVGAAGCVECSTPFTWFAGAGSSGPNRAGPLPDVSRFDELEKLASELLLSADAAKTANRLHAAQQYHDLAMTIRWVVSRARVGLAIWNEDAPLVKRLREAEALFDRGHKADAETAARSLASELSSLRFAEALQGLAATCRTRGELGMLATANARYGRFYAAFFSRLERLLGRRLLERGHWAGPAEQIVYPIPAHVLVGDSVHFDGVFLPAHGAAALQLQVAAGCAWAARSIGFQNLGGAYFRAGFAPTAPGVYLWSILPANTGGEVIATGAVTVLTSAPAASAVQAALPRQ